MSNNKMKQLLILIKLLIIITTSNVIGQEVNSQNYKHTPETKKFEGIWEFREGDMAITIILKNYEKFYIKNISSYADVIQGTVTYQKAGKIIYNDKDVIKNGRTGSVMPFELWGTYKEPEGKGGRLILTFKNPKDLTTLNLKIVPRNDLSRFKIPPLKIPEEIILKKKIE